MQKVTEQDYKVRLINDLAELKKIDTGLELTAEEFDYLYDMSLDELLQGIVNLKTLIEFKAWLKNTKISL